MDKSPKKQQPKVLPEKAVDLLINNILKKNGVVETEVKSKLSGEEKQAIKELVEDLSTQVDSFLNSNKNIKKDT